jgi:sigma-B regulation protein RsbU (phosphoserine phosphatase)
VTPETLQTLRHDLRTALNHIVGYGELLGEEAAARPGTALAADIEVLVREASNLHTVFLESFYQDGAPLESFDTEAFRRNLLAPLYIVLGLAQRLKKLCHDAHAPALAADVDKIADAGHSLVALLDEELTPGAPGPAADDYRYGMGRIARVAPASLADRNLGRILVVDDDEANCDLLTRQLERQGHRVTAVGSGSEALTLLGQTTFDLVVLDILMPGLSGYQVLERMKADAGLRDIPVIMISALDETNSVVHCIAMGAEDYLPKTFDPVLLRARIGACLAKKHYRDQEQKHVQELLESQRQLERELAEAADYVKDLLPKPSVDGPFRADWVFLPSAKLGGDCFDYHWVEPGKLGIFLLDVSGHGIGAALLSVSVMNVLRSQGLPHTDFADPADVLGSLNRHFQMENQNNLYFTIWYGVWNQGTGDLKFACAGSPPALLVPPGDGDETQELGTPDMIVGVDTDYRYENRRVHVVPGSRLYLFSDGVYEVRRPGGKMLAFREFTDLLVRRARSGVESTVEAVYDEILSLAGVEHFDDDFSLLEITFE